jgi:phospholipase C
LPEAVVPLDALLGLLGRSLLFSALAMAQDRGLTVPDIKQEDPVTGAQAVAIAHEVLSEIFPGMRD